MHMRIRTFATLWMQKRCFGVRRVSRTIGARMEADSYLEYLKRARLPSGNISCIFLQKYSLKLQIISKQAESSYRANQLTCLTSISIHRTPKPLSKMKTGSLEETRSSKSERTGSNAPVVTTIWCGICGQRGHNQLTYYYRFPKRFFSPI